MSAAVVQGNLKSFKSTVDGGLIVAMELDELQAAVFLETFGQINIPVALARLNDEQADESGEGSAMSDSTVRNL